MCSNCQKHLPVEPAGVQQSTTREWEELQPTLSNSIFRYLRDLLKETVHRAHGLGIPRG
jgi:hypothetical protein